MRGKPVSIDEIARWWDQQPCNIRHSNFLVGTEDWSRDVSRRKYQVEPHIPTFAGFDCWSDKQVLEVGCGIGTDTLQFLSHGAWVNAVDVSPEAVKLARRRCERFKRGAFFVCDAEEELPLAPRGEYDLAYSFGVLHHTPDPAAVVRNIHRVLRRGCEFRLMLYAKRSFKHWAGQQPEAQAGCPLVRWYTKEEVRQLLEFNGFKVVSIQQTHIFPWRVDSYKKGWHVMEWKWRWMPKWLFQWLEGKMGHHLLVVGRKL